MTRDIPVLAQIAPGFMTIPAAALEFSTRHKKAALVSDELEQFAHSHQAFLKTLRNAKSSDLLFAVRDLYHQDSNSAHLIWMETFRLAWMTFS